MRVLLHASQSLGDTFPLKEEVSESLPVHRTARVRQRLRALTSPAYLRNTTLTGGHMREVRQRCKVCGEVRPLEDFHRRTKGGKRSSRCKYCAAEAQRRHRLSGSAGGEGERYDWRRRQVLKRPPDRGGREVFECRMPSLLD